ncbi:MAG TPA: hypothetical protein VJT31_10240, partial [Rugosimonospora sp.]|nr:hypothetical protein [Rugosimonospora sp.]
MAEDAPPVLPPPGGGLRALVELAQAGLGMAGGAQDVLRIAIGQIGAVLHDRGTAWLTGPGGDGEVGDHGTEFAVAARAVYEQAGPGVLGAASAGGAWLRT